MNNKIISFTKMTRIQFVLPGILPFTLGSLAGLKLYNVLNTNLYLLCISGIILIMLMGFITNEYVDYDIDKLNKTSTQFSGGSKVLIENKLSRKTALITGIIFGLIFLVFIVTFYFINFYKSYPLLSVFGIIGFLIGIAYGDPPFKLSYKGFGEILTGFSCGYLALASGYYISAGRLDLIPFLLSIPPALTVFCLAFINAYPDIESDKIGGKKTLPVKYGIKNMNIVFIISIIISNLFLIVNPLLIPGMSKLNYIFIVPFQLISVLAILHLLSINKLSKLFFERISVYSILLTILASLAQIISFII